MTGAQVLERGRAAVRWLWDNPAAIAVLLACVFVFGNVRSCNLAKDATERANQAEERAAAAAAGVPVVQPVPDVRPQLEAALADNAQLRAELERAKQAVPGARPVAVVRAVASGRVSGPVSGGSSASAPASVPSEVSGVQPDVQPCVLHAGDELRFELDEVVLRGEAGAHLLAGTIGARRAADDFLLVRQALEAPFTVAVEKAPETQPAARWGAGPLVLAGREGWAAGALLATPSARVPLLGWRVEALAGGAAGPSGTWGAVAGAVFRP